MAAKTRGKLKPKDEKKITKNYVYLLDNMDPTLDGVLDDIYSRGTFDAHDKDIVENDGENTARGRADRFLKILQRSGEGAYEVFLEVLRNCGNEHIANTLEATDVSDIDQEGPDAWIDKLPEDIKQQTPTDAQASQLSVVFGKGWQHVFRELGVTDVKIQQAEMTSVHSPGMAITSLIIKWRQKHARGAHLIKLLKAMAAVYNDGRCPSIDWTVVKRAVTREQDSS